ncbi:hypothetical protein ACWY4P_48075 [Streptomyces sp. LZ34]
MTRLAQTEGVAGIAVPPLVQGRSYDHGVLREVLAAAAELGLAVLVHPSTPRHSKPTAARFSA